MTIELGKEVLQITERVYKENKALVKMFGNPSEKLFGWIGDVYYPYPPREFRNNQLMIRDKARDRNEVNAEIPTVNFFFCVISMEIWRMNLIFSTSVLIRDKEHL